MTSVCVRDIHNFIYLDSINNEVLNKIMHLPDGLRKEIRLLAKQYEILEFYKEDDIFMDISLTDRRKVVESPFVIIYKSPDSNEEFKWEIEPERLY